MRVIAGQWKGRPLQPPPGPGTRPILDQVKEALFNILGAQWASPGVLPPVQVLDLFSGTGTLGLEALSRGAAHCVFLERDRPTAAVLRHNIATLGATDVSDVRIQDIWRLRPQRDLAATFDLVFLDPPYPDACLERDAPLTRLLTRMHRDRCVGPAGLLILRHPKSVDCTADQLPDWNLFDQRRYGGMTLTLLRPRELA